MAKEQGNVTFDRGEAEKFKGEVIFLVTPYKRARECVSIVNELIWHFETHPQAKTLPHQYFFPNIDATDWSYRETYFRLYHIPKDQLKIAEPRFIRGHKIVEVTW